MSHVIDPSECAEAIYRTYGPDVYAVAYRLTASAEDAEDVTRKVLLRLVRRLDPCRCAPHSPRWLRRTTVAAVLALREREEPCPSSDNPNREARDASPHGRMERAIARLSVEYRDPFVLCDVEGWPHAEVCAVLGLSPEVLRSRLRHAREALRNSLAASG